MKPTFTKETLIKLYHQTYILRDIETKVREYQLDIWEERGDKPHKPSLDKNATPDEIRKYADIVQQYEYDVLEYNERKELYEKYNREAISIFEEVIKEVSGLNEIPEQYRDKVYSYAYSEGHSDGYVSIYNKLVELVKIFE